MPVKDSIELGSGHLYFKGVDEPIEIGECEILSAEEDYADDVKYINWDSGPITFECKAAFNRNWTLVKCERCGCEFPITEFYALINGTRGWICPACKFNDILEEARRNKPC